MILVPISRFVPWEANRAIKYYERLCNYIQCLLGQASINGVPGESFVNMKADFNID